MTRTSGEPAVRECDCPDWVIRCAHFENGFMQVRDYGWEDPDLPRYELCGWWNEGPVDYWQGYLGNDEDAAHDAFLEAEEWLLKGGAE